MNANNMWISKCKYIVFPYFINEPFLCLGFIAIQSFSITHITVSPCADQEYVVNMVANESYVKQSFPFEMRRY
jgi:hypothetical protein